MGKLTDPEVTPVLVAKFYLCYQQVCENVKEAFELLPRATLVYERAKGYWYGHLSIDLNSDHSYLGRSMCTMEDTLFELYSKVPEGTTFPEISEMFPDSDLSDEEEDEYFKLEEAWSEVEDLARDKEEQKS